MENEIRDRFNEEILAQARQRYGIAADQITLLDGFESFMYEYAQDGGAFILRLGHSRRRSPEMIRGEVDWINYLAAGGAGVARAVLSANGKLVEEISDGHGGAFLATAFEKAAGGPVRQMEYNTGNRCELGIETAVPFRRRGLATLLATATIRHALAQGVADIGWVCWADNRPSVATALKLGFQQVAQDEVYEVIFAALTQHAGVGSRLAKFGRKNL